MPAFPTPSDDRPDAPKTQRRIVRALFKSAIRIDEDMRWRRFRFDAAMLKRRLSAIGQFGDDIVRDIADNCELTVIRRDPFTISYRGFEKQFSRDTLAEGAGAMGIRFLPARRCATRRAFEAAREIAYFGFGPLQSQIIPCPIGQLTREIVQIPDCPDGTILRDLRPDFAQDQTVCELLAADRYFGAPIHSPADLEKFQRDLRANPMSESFVRKCADFFNRKATVGARDSLRWFLGARHPRFDWTRAEYLIQSAFGNFGTDDFNTPQITYYAYDPDIDDVEADAALADNARVVKAFADRLKDEIRRAHDGDFPALSDAQWIALARAALDIHHDCPDFDLEAQNETGPQKQFDFMEHSLQNAVHSEILGKNSTPRRNLNFRAHFGAHGILARVCPELGAAGAEILFAAIDAAVAQYDADGGIKIDPSSDACSVYNRIPCIIFMIRRPGASEPKDDERRLDSFDLSQITQLEHASYMRSFPEISEKLTVFFALTLRHLIDTEHVPDLRPRNLPRDFLLLGLWGTRSPNIRVNLFVDKSLPEKDYAKKLKRCEIKFTGSEQTETHPLNHIRESSKVMRLAFAHLAPLIEPSILRNLGTFAMAMEEFRNPGHAPRIDPWNLAGYAVGIIREITRCGVRQSLGDVLSILEYVLDNAHENVKKRIASKLNDQNT